jgi:hypothetical protein
MTEETFERVMSWVEFFIKQGTQRTELNLAGIGESTLHPQFVKFVERATRVVGHVVFATNGLLLTKELVDELRPWNPEVWVSLHRPDRINPDALEYLRASGMLRATTMDAVNYPNSWGGQIKWSVAKNPARADGKLFPCPWRFNGQGFVAADGRLLTCCLDGTGESEIGNVHDAPRVDIQVGAWKLCTTCYQYGPEDG